MSYHVIVFIFTTHFTSHFTILSCVLYVNMYLNVSSPAMDSENNNNN